MIAANAIASDPCYHSQGYQAILETTWKQEARGKEGRQKASSFLCPKSKVTATTLQRMDFLPQMDNLFGEYLYNGMILIEREGTIKDTSTGFKYAHHGGGEPNEYPWAGW